MTVIHYWQTLSRRFMIKAALPHLFLGVIAAGFSLSDQQMLPYEANQQVSIMTIASAMANIQELQSANQIVPLHYPNQETIQTTLKVVLFSAFVTPIKVTRLTPNNGIRAGPLQLQRLII